jgi:hypothetical protein
MSVLIADYTLVVRRQALDGSYPGGAERYVRTLLELDVPPQFVCNDANLVSASFATPSALHSAHRWAQVFGIRAQMRVDQIVGPDRECEWLEWKRESSVLTHAWLAGTDPGDIAAPKGWAPREHRIIDEMLSEAAVAADAAAANAFAKSRAMDAVRAALDGLEWNYAVFGSDIALFDVDTDCARYVFSIAARDRGVLTYVCVPKDGPAARNSFGLGKLLTMANQAGARSSPRFVYFFEQIGEDWLGCCLSFVPEEPTADIVEIAIDALLDFADDAQALLSTEA